MNDFNFKKPIIHPNYLGLNQNECEKERLLKDFKDPEIENLNYLIHRNNCFKNIVKNIAKKRAYKEINENSKNNFYSGTKKAGFIFRSLINGIDAHHFSEDMEGLHQIYSEALLSSRFVNSVPDSEYAKTFIDSALESLGYTIQEELAQTDSFVRQLYELANDSPSDAIQLLHTMKQAQEIEKGTIKEVFQTSEKTTARIFNGFQAMRLKAKEKTGKEEEEAEIESVKIIDEENHTKYEISLIGGKKNAQDREEKNLNLVGEKMREGEKQTGPILVITKTKKRKPSKPIVRDTEGKETVQEIRVIQDDTGSRAIMDTVDDSRQTDPDQEEEFHTMVTVHDSLQTDPDQEEEFHTMVTVHDSRQTDPDQEEEFHTMVTVHDSRQTDPYQEEDPMRTKQVIENDQGSSKGKERIQRGESNEYEGEGEGSFKQCLYCYDSISGEKAAFLKLQILNDDEREELREELSIHRMLASAVPHVVPKINDFDLEKSNMILVEHFHSNGERYLNKLMAQEGGISQKDRSYLAVQLTEIVQHLHHNNIAHCDIKPENFLVEENKKDNSPGKARICITDFGTSKFLPEGEAIQEELITGTPGFADARQLDGFRGFESDVYALGVMLLGLEPENEGRLLVSGSNVIHVIGNTKNLALMTNRDFVNHFCKKLGKQAVDLSEFDENAATGELAVAAGLTPRQQLIARMVHPKYDQRPTIDECCDLFRYLDERNDAESLPEWFIKGGKHPEGWSYQKESRPSKHGFLSSVRGIFKI